MSRAFLNELHEEILHRLTKKDFIKKINISEEKMQALLLNKAFATKLSALVAKDNISCNDVFELSIEILDSLVEKLPKDWLKYVYNYVLYKSFPDLVSLDLKPKYENACIVYLEILQIVFLRIERYQKSDELSFDLFANSDIKLEKNANFQKFVKIYNDNYIYELIRLNDEVTNSKLYHKIKSTWNSSLKLASKMKNANIELKYWMMFSLLTGLFIGDLAAKICPNKHNNSYYTNQWFEKFDLSNIIGIEIYRDISSVNFNCLTIEALILLYSDSKENIKDFEFFLSNPSTEIIDKSILFLEENEIINYYRNISINSNFRLMSLLSDEESFNYMLERAKSAKSWKEIMTYLNVFNEFSLFLNKNRKLKILDFLYNLLSNEDHEIRKSSAKLLGKIIALLDANKLHSETDIPSLSMKLWEKYLGLFMLSKNSNDKENAAFYLYDFIDSFIENTSSDNLETYIEILLINFEKISSDEYTSALFLTSLASIKIKLFSDKQIEFLFDNIIKYLNSDNEDIKFISLNYIYTITQSDDLEDKLRNSILKKLKIKMLKSIQAIKTEDKLGINFLKYKILLSIDKTDKIITEYNEFMRLKSKRISEIFLINLKSATNWMEKIVNIDFILDIARNSNDVVILHAAAHLSNLVKVSAKELVRNKAGKALLSISSFLTSDQRNEISIELTKGLEIGEFEISRYIPSHLGKFILLLDTKELDEIIFEILRLYKDSDNHVSSLALEVFSVMIENYSEHKDIFEQNIDEYDTKFIKILSIIIGGLANNDEQIKRDALLLIGNQIFNSRILSPNDKYKIFKIIAKKLISLKDEKNRDYLNFLNTAVSFNHIYKFLNDYSKTLKEKYPVISNEKIAYFFNSFDPFTLEHKRLIKETKKQGYVVFLKIDEFNWQKNTIAYKIRKKIVEISIADELGVYLLPENVKINTKNVLNIQIKEEGDNANIDSQALKYISNIGISITSTGTARNKAIVNKRSFKIEVINNFGLNTKDSSKSNISDEMSKYIYKYTNLLENVGEELSSKNMNLLVIRDNSREKKLLGFSAFHQIGTAQMYSEFKNIEVASYVRENTSGKIIIIDGIYTNPSENIPELEQSLLTETLLYSLKNDFTYALYCNTLLNYDNDKIFELLKLHGFKKLDFEDLKNDIYAVDMKFPLCLTLDMQNYIKEPLISSERIKNSIAETRKRLKLELTKVYPNNLVLYFDVQMLQQAIVEKINEGNKDYLCVPFGNVFNGKAVANFTTKSLHIEKCFKYDTGDYEIKEYPFYPSVSKQIDVIKAFDKPVILVDDVMHNCHEFIGIDKILKNKTIPVKNVIAGILSSQGKDRIEMQGRVVDSAYFIPNLRLWLRESMLYPFFGGNSALGDDKPKLNLIPSINQILPYASPSFMSGTSKEVIYDLSKLCLENAMNIASSLELEYKNIFDRNLVLRNLYQVLNTPRYPVKGNNISYDLNQGISSYIENDIKNLARIESIVKI